MKNAVYAVALVAAILAVPALEAQQPCHICVGADNGAKCHQQNIPDFSMQKCELRCFYYLTEICFCRTFGDTCAINPPSIEGGDLPAAGPDAGARYELTPKTRDSLHRQAGPIVSGLLDWPIPPTLRGPGPHRIAGVMSEGGVSYDYAGEIHFLGGSAVLHYAIEGHPKIATVDAQFGIAGYGGTVIVKRSDGEQKIYDMFGGER